MTLRSMTGYGSGSASSGTVRIDAEIRSVNSRFLDLTCRLPQQFSSAEPEAARIIRAKLARGRVELFVNRVMEVEQQGRPSFDKAAFEDLFNIYKEALTAAGVEWRTHLPELAFSLLTRKEVVGYSGSIEDPAKAAPDEIPLLLQAVEQALDQLIKMREEEGRALFTELVSLLNGLESTVGLISSHAAAVPQTFADRLKARLAKLFPAGEIDPIRLAQEAAFLAERTDITEEIARLKSHLQQFHKYLAESVSGKKLDFLVQELGREFNTVGSKVQNGDVAILIVEAKAVLEKIREQIQNIE